MAVFTEESVIDSINVTEFGVLEIRQANKVYKDGVEISKTYHRNTLAPGASLDGQDEKVVAIAEAVWIPEVIAAYQAQEV